MSAAAPRPAVFLDRDGTLNADEGYTHRPEDLRWMPGAVAAVRRINAAGWLAFIVTNQSGIARGFYTVAQMEEFHAAMRRDLAAAGAWLDEIAFCPFHPEAALPEYRRDAPCRKPRPGMILDLAARRGVDLARSFLVGDREVDMQAAEAAGIRGLRYRGGDLEALVAAGLDDARLRAD